MKGAVKTGEGAVVVSVIAAVAENGVIGRDGDLPWRLPADLQRFKALTWGHPMIMGRRTYDSIGRPLPGRRSIVLSRNPAALGGAAGVTVAGDLGNALEIAAAGLEPRVDGDAEARQVFIIGGAEIYRQALPLADRLYLTRIHAEIDGETHFPALEAGEWRLVEAEAHPADARHAYPFTFERYERRKAKQEDP